MKIGLSSYSLYRAMQSKQFDILDVVQWVADNGGVHVELAASLGFDLEADPDLIDQIRKKANDVGIAISNYAVGANFIQESHEALEQEIQKVKKQVDVANRLGIKLMRHDVASRPLAETTVKRFDEDLEQLAAACREIADYAANFGITTSVENHGYYVQASERVQRLIHTVDRPNFKTTMDIGNFMCVDEDPVAAVKRNITYASMVHLKDFYLRTAANNPGEGWFGTTSGNYLRGAIVGQGDIDMREVIKVIKQSTYDGYISIEFEGMEDCIQGSKIGMDNALRIWNEV